MNLWDLLPAAVAARAKAVLAVIGGIGFVVVSFYPSVAADHYAAVAIAVLTALGVWAAPNVNAKTRAAARAKAASLTLNQARARDGFPPYPL